MAKEKSWWEQTREEAEGKVNATINDVKGKVGASVNDIKGGGSGPSGFGEFGSGGGVDIPNAPPSSMGGLGNIGGGGFLETLLAGLGAGGLAGLPGQGGSANPFTGTNDPWYIFHKKPKAYYEPVDVEKYYGQFQGAGAGDGKLQSNYELDKQAELKSQLSDDDLGLKTLRTRATETGPSAWRKMATEDQQLDEQNMLNQANQSQAGQLAEARSGLAMRGGLRGGAAERLEASGQENALLGGQGIRNQGMQGRLGIGMQDESNKLNLLSQLPGAELAQAGYKSGLDQQNVSNRLVADQFNIGNRLADLGAQNQWKKDLAAGTIAATGAAQTASATENAGKK